MSHITHNSLKLDDTDNCLWMAEKTLLNFNILGCLRAVLYYQSLIIYTGLGFFEKNPLYSRTSRRNC